jgi:hypothetical protein
LNVRTTCSKRATCSKISCIKMKRMMEMKCRGEKEHNQGSQGKCNNPDCSVCPVCSTFIFLAQYEWSAKYFRFKKNYRLINTGYLSSYIPPVWKPPNSYFRFSSTT